MLKFLKESKMTTLVAVWGIAAISGQITLVLSGLDYDSRGAGGIFWWSVQIISMPVTIVSEALGVIGIPASGTKAFVLLTLTIVFLFGLALFLRYRRRRLAS